jgi:hypothetical protein
VWHSEECAESLTKDTVDEFSPLIGRDGAELVDPLLNLRKTFVTELPPLDVARGEGMIESVCETSGDLHLSKAESCFEACLISLRGAIDPVDRDREWLFAKALPITLHQGRKASSSCCSDSTKARLTPYAVGSERK